MKSASSIFLYLFDYQYINGMTKVKKNANANFLLKTLTH